MINLSESTMKAKYWRVIFCLAFVTSVASADEPAIEEIVVTAQKIERSLQDTHESVTVITGYEIERRGIQTLEDIYNQTANVFDLGNNEGFGIRGVTNNSGSTGGGSGELATYFIDGVAVTGFGKRFVPMDMWDVAQVEILRGPQSTNLGRNAMMGAVVISSASPSMDGFDADFMVGIGNENRRETAGMVNVPLGETAALRFSGEFLETDGYIDNPTRGEDDFDARENQTFRAKLLWEPTDELSILAALQYVESERGQNLFRFDLIDDVEDRDNLGALDDGEELDGTLMTLDINYDLNQDWALRSITSFFDTEYDRFDDDDLSPANGNAFRGRLAKDENWAQELRADYSGEKLRGNLGVYYTEVDIDNRTLGLVNINPTLVGVPDLLLPFYPSVLEVDVNSPFFGETENMALFTEWEWDFTDDWRLIAGLRYETEEQDNDARVANTLNPGTPLPDPAVAGAQAAAVNGPAVGAQVEAGVAAVNAVLLAQLTPTQELTSPDFDVTLGKFGLVWDVSESAQLGFIFSQGYRSGGAELSLSGRTSDYDPEYLNNFELSLRSQFWEGQVTLNANFFYSDWQDQQVTIGLNGNIFDTVLENAGESTLYGGEIELRANPSENLRLFATLGYTRTEFDDYVSVLDGDLSGNEFAFSPNWTGALGGTYYFHEHWYVGASITWQTEMYGDVQNAIELDERTLLNVQAGYEGERYTVRLYGKNVTDEVYVTSQGTGLVPGSIVGKLGDPLEVGLQVTFSL